MNENLNLVEILKDYPKGTHLYSPICGMVTLKRVDTDDRYPIAVESFGDEGTISTIYFTKKGKLYEDFEDSETILFPSKTQRDWSKFKIKKPKFNPKTLKPFDKVLIRTFEKGMWCASFISVSADKLRGIPDIIGDYDFDIVIPYNEDTKHLVGTTEDAPEYYRYWED